MPRPRAAFAEVRMTVTRSQGNSQQRAGQGVRRLIIIADLLGTHRNAARCAENRRPRRERVRQAGQMGMTCKKNGESLITHSRQTLAWHDILFLSSPSLGTPSHRTQLIRHSLCLYHGTKYSYMLKKPNQAHLSLRRWSRTALRYSFH